MKKPLLREKLRVRFESKWVLVFVPERGEIYEFNPTAASIIKLCDGIHTFNEIVKIISEEYKNSDARIVKRDLSVFFKDLESLGVVIWKNDERNVTG